MGEKKTLAAWLSWPTLSVSIPAAGQGCISSGCYAILQASRALILPRPQTHICLFPNRAKNGTTLCYFPGQPQLLEITMSLQVYLTLHSNWIIAEIHYLLLIDPSWIINRGKFLKTNRSSEIFKNKCLQLNLHVTKISKLLFLFIYLKCNATNSIWIKAYEL